MMAVSSEYKLAEQRWEDAFAMADACLSFFNEGMTVDDIILVMKKNQVDVERALQLAKAFPPAQRSKSVPITVYQQVCRYPEPQKTLERAWDKNMYAIELAKDFKKFRGQGFIPVPARAEHQTPIEVALGVDDEGMTTAKKLYAFLELHSAHYSKWVRKNIEENIFAEPGIDYEVFTLHGENPLGGRPTRDYKLTSSFAKKLAMSSQTEKGEIAREYFIRVEQNAKALANGALNCISPQYGAMRPEEAAQLILETTNRFKDRLPKVCVEKMMLTALNLQGIKQIS